MSFLEDVNQMVIDAVYQDIAEQLLDDWINNNLDDNLLKCQEMSLSMLSLINSIILKREMRITYVRLYRRGFE